jgi:hypothetical protein
MKEYYITMYEDFVSQFDTYKVVLKPDRNVTDWWAGAPSVILTDEGTFYLAARMREGNSPRGLRGYEIRLLKSVDGYQFEHIHSIKREQVPIPGFERPALVIDPETKRLKLYACGPFQEGRGWEILKFDDVEECSEFDPHSAQVVLRPEAYHEKSEVSWGRMQGYKDPFVFWAENQWHMYVIGYDLVERVYHFTSPDGETWENDPNNPVLDNGGWHNFYTRPASVLPASVGYLFIYEGSNSSWFDPAYNIATGLAYTLDLSHIIDLTPEAPLLKSTTPGNYHTWRYSHWLNTGKDLCIYSEVARPNSTNEIRVSVLKNAGKQITQISQHL